MSAPIPAAKYNMRLNPVYQVDWQNAASGKRLSATKRRVRWRFGFSNAEAIEQGLTGTECRGEEHEVSLVWSLASGKRLVVADGQEVHFSFGKRTDTKFETSWTMHGGHMIKLIAYAAPPLFLTPGFKQFDLLLDGCSFFDMPKIYQLGCRNQRAVVPRSVPRGETQPAYNNYALPPAARNEYYQEEKKEEDSSTPPRPSAPAVDLVSEPTKDLLDTTPSSTQQPVVDEFAPAPTPPPTFEAVSNNILSAYGPPPATHSAVPVLANESHTYGYPPTQQPPQQAPAYNQPQPTVPVQQTQGYYEQQQQQQAYYQQPTPITPDSSVAFSTRSSMDVQSSFSSSDATTVVTPTMEPMSLQELEERDQPPMSAMDKALKLLVNFDDIADEMETPEQIKSKEKKLSNQPSKSKPLPPTKGEWHLGNHPALKDLKEHALPKKEPTREIMRTHAFDPAAAQAGMMVVYGSTTTQQQGFGYAAQQQQYAQQQQQQPYGGYYYGQQQPVMPGAYY